MLVSLKKTHNFSSPAWSTKHVPVKIEIAIVFDELLETPVATRALHSPGS